MFRKWLLVAAGASISLILFLLAVGLAYEATGNDFEPSSDQIAFLVTAEDLVRWGAPFDPNPAQQLIAATEYLDGAREIRYEYDDPQGGPAPYINCTVNLEPSVEDAQTVYEAAWGGVQLGFKAGKVDLIQKDDQLGWGERSRFALLERQGTPVGAVFVALHGKKVFYLLMTGADFSSSAGILDIVTPALSQLEGYSVL